MHPGSDSKPAAVLITGADGQLGGIALAVFRELGWRVVASARDPEAAEAVRSRLSRSGISDVPVLAADLTRDKEAQSLVEQAEAATGGLAAAFHTVGGFRFGATWDATPADFEFLVDANFRSSWSLARHLAPRLQTRGSGSLVFMSSKATLGPLTAGLGLYGATKLALNGLVTSLAAELAPAGVRVNALLPTVIDTPANRASMPNANPADWVSPTAIAEAAAYLASPAAYMINGALITLPGRLS